MSGDSEGRLGSTVVTRAVLPPSGSSGPAVMVAGLPGGGLATATWPATRVVVAGGVDGDRRGRPAAFRILDQQDAQGGAQQQQDHQGKADAGKRQAHIDAEGRA